MMFRPFLVEMLVYIDTASVVTMLAVGGSGGSLSIMSSKSVLFLIYDGRCFFSVCSFSSIHVEMKAVKLPHWAMTGLKGTGVLFLCTFGMP